MKLKTEIIDQNIELKESTLNRDVDVLTKKDHIDYEYQAKICTDQSPGSMSIHGGFTFYGKGGEYLGIATDYCHLNSAPFVNPYYIKMEISIPKGTESVSCELKMVRMPIDRWGLFLAAAGVLTVLLLLSLLVSLWI